MVHRTHKNRDKSIHVIMSSLLGLIKIVILSLANKREVTFCDNIRKLNYPTVRFGPCDRTNFQKTYSRACKSHFRIAELQKQNC